MNRRSEPSSGFSSTYQRAIGVANQTFVAPAPPPKAECVRRATVPHQKAESPRLGLGVFSVAELMSPWERLDDSMRPELRR